MFVPSFSQLERATFYRDNCTLATPQVCPASGKITQTATITRGKGVSTNYVEFRSKLAVVRCSVQRCTLFSTDQAVALKETYRNSYKNDRRKGNFLLWIGKERCGSESGKAPHTHGLIAMRRGEGRQPCNKQRIRKEHDSA